MNVNWNPNISSEWWKELSSVNSRTESQNANSSNVTLGSDSVQISQNAINALYRSEQEGEDNTSSQNNNSSDKLSEVLDDLVTSGTITQEQEDKIKETLDKSSQAPPPPPPQQGGSGQSLEDKLKSLESAGTINKDQLNTIVDALKTSADEDTDSDSDSWEEILNNLVSSDTITQEQEDKIKETLDKSSQAPPPPPPQQGGSGQSLEDKLKSLESAGTINKDQLNTIVDALKTSADEDTDSDSDSWEEILNNLVSYDTITQEQEDEIKEALSKSFQAPPPPPPQQGGSGQSLEDKLKSLESAGTINKDQLNAITDALKTSADEDNQSQTDEDQENAISNNFKSALKAYGMQLYGL